MPPEKICPYCQKIIPKKANLCPSCGMNLNIDISEEEKPNNQSEKKMFFSKRISELFVHSTYWLMFLLLFELYLFGYKDLLFFTVISFFIILVSYIIIKNSHARIYNYLIIFNIFIFLLLSLLQVSILFGIKSIFNPNGTNDIMEGVLMTGVTLEDCTYSFSDEVVENPFYTYELNVFGLDEGKNFMINKDSGTRRFSFEEYKNNGKGLKEDLVFYAGRTDQQEFFGNQLEISLQLCNKENKTVSTKFISGGNEGSVILVLYAKDPEILPKFAGTYRADAIIKVKGQNQLIGRIDEIVYTN
jgi:hypothetical protein